MRNAHQLQNARNLAVVFDVENSASELPLVRGRKWIKKCPCLRCSWGFVVHAPRLRNGIRLQANMRPARGASCTHFPFFDSHKRAPEGQRSAVAFFCLHFLGEARKVSSCRSTTGRQSKNYHRKSFKAKLQRHWIPAKSTRE